LEDEMKKTLCIYHGNCADGFTAAWAVRKLLGDEGVEYYAGHYGTNPPDVAGRHVVMVDFSYKRPVLVQMAEAAESVLILDHHKTAKEDLASLGWSPADVNEYGAKVRTPRFAVVFDMDRSGAQIAWDFFHPGKPRPKIVDYVGDRDLWKFVLPQSREANAYIFANDYSFEKWDSLATLFDYALDDVIHMGAAIELKHHKDIKELVSVNQRTMRIGGHEVPVANLPYTMSSDAGNLMAQGHPFAACYWDTRHGRTFSLRSTQDGMDVSAIAAQYGGGGHRNAAGFQVPRGWEGE
jgi:oligoribonuclease NrnB/cAMP/cGMP phosphodiesterase (DHH superfamily)